MVGLERNLLLAIGSRPPAEPAAKCTDVELPAIAFLVQLEQHIVGGAGSVGHVKIEGGPELSHPIIRGWSVDEGVPMHLLDSVGKYIGGSSAHLGLADCLSLNEDEIASVPPVHSHFGRRKIWAQGCRTREGNDCRHRRS